MTPARLRPQIIVLMAALVVQYALGMYINMFISFPDQATEGQLWEFAWAHWPVSTHIILAGLLALGAIVLCVRAARVRSRPLIWSSLIALLALFVAGGSGGQFIPTQNDAWSYSMALAFIVAFCAYAWGLWAAREP